MKIHDHQDQTQTERDAYLIKQLELSVHYVVLQILPRPNSRIQVDCNIIMDKIQGGKQG